MPDAPKPSLTRPILVAALITLVITGLRLLGEIEDWDATYFSRESGGKGAVIGISWLPILFGFWFGRRLVKGGRGPRSVRRAMVLPLCGLLLVTATFGICSLLKLPPTTTFYAFSGAAWVGALLAMTAWPALFGVNLTYGVLARVPVMVVIWLAVTKGWNVHYAKVPPLMPPMAGNDLALFLALGQAGFWIPYTIMVGGFSGALAAALARK
jgi:hypothetical protein